MVERYLGDVRMKCTRKQVEIALELMQSGFKQMVTGKCDIAQSKDACKSCANAELCDARLAVSSALRHLYRPSTELNNYIDSQYEALDKLDKTPNLDDAKEMADKIYDETEDVVEIRKEYEESIEKR